MIKNESQDNIRKHFIARNSFASNFMQICEVWQTLNAFFFFWSLSFLFAANDQIQVKWKAFITIYGVLKMVVNLHCVWKSHFLGQSKSCENEHAAFFLYFIVVILHADCRRWGTGLKSWKCVKLKEIRCALKSTFCPIAYSFLIQ